MYAEAEAATNQQTLFWRISSRGYASDIKRCEEIKSKISFGDSLLSGYIWDGVMNSDIEVANSNYSACVYSYYDTHRQGREKWSEVKNTGSITTGKYSKYQVKFENLSDSLQNYLKTLDNHELYAVKFDNEELMNKKDGNTVYIPDSTISSAACYQSGETFHPSINRILKLKNG